MIVYNIFTDGAADQVAGIAASACIIKSLHHYVASKVKITRLNRISDVETLAVGIGIKTLLSRVDITPDNVVRIYVDNRSTISFLQDAGKPGAQLRSSVKSSRWAWYQVKKLRSICKVELVKISGHMCAWNCNNCVDKLAKYSLRDAVRKAKGQVNE